ncbi:MBL fold metallo-hydrolase [Planctomicrobium sp. SH527]|uniref:MBL fold metallo-hydrolase n=1 Tax=Planctomicrobium sp. SH527 TaxID=3448123 RepID=UPI003F5BEE18
MRIELLGTGGYYANDRRQTACIMLPEIGLIFDAGSGLYRIADHISTSSLNIFLTHAHLDHIVGLPYLLIPLLRNQIEKITIHGYEPTLNSVRNHLLATAIFPADIPLEYKILSESGSIDVATDCTLRWQPLHSHPGGSIAFRLDINDPDRRRSLAYITDTRVDGSYFEFARNADLLIHECNFPDSQADIAAMTGHSHTTQVAEFAKSANVGRLLIVHVDATSPEIDPVNIPAMQAIFPNTELGTDHMSLTV